MRSKLLPRAAAGAIAVLGLGAAAAFAGEATGVDAQANQNQGVSWCSFSGLNDDPDGVPVGPPGRTQSYGTNVANDFFIVAKPGIACNPIRTFLPDNPNRTKPN